MKVETIARLVPSFFLIIAGCGMIMEGISYWLRDPGGGVVWVWVIINMMGLLVVSYALCRANLHLVAKLLVLLRIRG